MNEPEVARKIRHLLDSSVDSMEPDIARKLHLARERALAHSTQVGAHAALAGGGSIGWEEILPRARTVVALLMLAASVAGLSYWNSIERANELAEVDTALLADDLPINAYLDSGFDAWLKRSSQP